MTCAEEIGSRVDGGSRGRHFMPSGPRSRHTLAKRSNGDGTIVQRRDGRFCAIATLPNGSRRCMYARTKSEANAKLRAALETIRKGSDLPSEKLNVETFMRRWLEAKRAQVRPRTWMRYEGDTRVHILPAIGHLKLVRLEPRHLEALYSDSLQSGLSSTSVHHLHTMIHGALHHALRRGLVLRNVADLVDPPSLQHHEMLFLTPDEVQTFLDSLEDDPMEALYTVAATTGMREGELFGLHWRQVDLRQGTISVITQLERGGDQPVFSAPKTARSRRRVLLCARAVETLQKHKARQSEQRLHVGSEWRDLDVVFPNEIGGPLCQTNVIKRSFRPALRRARLPRLRFHDLRHTAATTLLAQGVNPKVVSEMLGHSSVAFTLQTYSHVVEGMQRDAVRALDDLFGEPAALPPEPPVNSRLQVVGGR
jgi:integrase